MLSPLLALAALAPKPGGGAMLNELLLDKGGGAMEGKAFVLVTDAGFIGGGAMLKLV
jgi:hypothetical protein